MRLSLLPPSLLWLLLSTTANTQAIVNDVSFGHKSPLSPSGDGQIPGWRSSTSGHTLQVLSDRVILTPPIPGNARGALWTEKAIDTETWTADVEFRASGQDQGSGSLNIWYVKDNRNIFTDSGYTASYFDGLVLIIDQYGGRGGSIRGFLNDGTQNFRSHKDHASLAFGHCDYSYRNLGRPSKVTLSSIGGKESGLAVYVDDRLCFSSDKISLPSGYYFGLTAATQEQPDSFEAYKFAVSTGIPHEHQNVMKGGAPPQPQRGSSNGGSGQERLQPRNNASPLSKLDKFPGAPEAVPDRVADDIKGTQDQFADLHNRLQGITHQVANIFQELADLSSKLDQRHNDILARLEAGGNVGKGGLDSGVLVGKIDAIARRLENTELIAERVRKDVEGRDYKENLNRLNEAIEGVTGSVGQAVTASAPRMGFFLFVVVGVQVALAAAYAVYKRRRNSMPKKYL